MKLTNVTKLGQHLTLAFGIVDVKAYLGLQRSANLNPVYVTIWLAFAECQSESPGLTFLLITLFSLASYYICSKGKFKYNSRLLCNF